MPNSPGMCLFIGGLALMLLAGGCTPTPPNPDAANIITAAAGIDRPLVLRADGGPLDEPFVGDRLTATNATVLAVTTDPRIQAALARVRAAATDAEGARLLPNPILNVVMRWGPGGPNWEVSVTQDLIQMLRIPRGASAADNRLRQAAAEAVSTALDVIEEVQERYASAQASAALTPIFQQRLEILDRTISVAQARLDAGEGTRAELATLQSQHVELLVVIDAARLSERENRLRLARLIGEPSSAASWTLDTWVSPAIDSRPEAAWITAALQSRPEIQSIGWRLAALGDDQALASFFPWDGANLGVDVQSDDGTTAGPTISTPIPIFDTGQARRDRLTAEQIEARHQLTLARRKVVEEVRVAHQALAASTANLDRVQRELIPIQQQRRSLAESAYRAGQSDVTALFLAEQDLRLAMAQAIEIEHRVTAAQVRLHRAVGGPGIAGSIARATPAVTGSSQPQASLTPSAHSHP